MATDKSTTSDDMYDLLNDLDFLNDSPKSIKEKRQLVKIKKEFDNLPKVNATPAKKLKVNEDIGDAGEMRQRTLNLFNHQLQASKQIDDNLLKSIDKVIADIEADYDVLDDNVQELQQRSGLLLKCMHQMSAAHKEKLESIDAIYSTYKKQCEEKETKQKAEMEELGRKLDEDFQKLKQKVISETKRSEWENMQKTFFKAMENDF